MNRRASISWLAAAALVTAAGLSPSGVRAAEFHKTIPVPRSGRATLGWSAGRCSVLGVSLRNYPNADDIRKARREDPDDKSWVWWDFQVENRGSDKCRIALYVDVYDRGGAVVKSSDKSDTVDAHKMDDNIRVSTRMRTLDIANASKARIRAEISP